MDKQIVYVVTDSGIDGLAPTTVLYASFEERERDAMVEADKAKAWRSKAEKIIDVASARAQALAKLDGVDRLVWGLPAWPNRAVDALRGQGNPTQAQGPSHRLAEDRRRTILQQNPLVRPNRPKTNMRLSGVTAYGIDLAAMLSVLLQRHGYLQQEPEDLSALLAAGDLAVAEAEAHLDDMKPDVTTFEDALQLLDAALTIPEVHRLVEQMDAGANADKPSVRFSATDWEAWTQVVSAKVHTLEADSPPNVNDRVYFCSQDDPTQSGWYLLHRVRNVSGQIDSPDCLVTLCRENNEPGEYINTVASQIHRTQP